MNLLVVDDEPDAGPLFRQRFRQEMQRGQVRLEVAESGTDALRLLENFHKEIPLIILSDINMPGMDGIELLRRIRDQYPELQVWMVSAYFHNRNYVDQATEHGATAFIPKPIDFGELKERIFGTVAS